MPRPIRLILFATMNPAGDRTLLSALERRFPDAGLIQVGSGQDIGGQLPNDSIDIVVVSHSIDAGHGISADLFRRIRAGTTNVLFLAITGGLAQVDEATRAGANEAGSVDKLVRSLPDILTTAGFLDSAAA